MRHSLAAAMGAVIACWAAPVQALSIACVEGFRAGFLALDPAQSAISPESGAPQPLSGLLRVEVGSLPLTSPTTFEIVRVDVGASGGGVVRLDPTLPSAGLGALFVDRSFVVPTLFLRLSQDGTGQDLAVANLAGRVELDPVCGNTVTRLEASFEVDSLGPAGVLSVAIVAAPEPRSGWIGALAALALLRPRRAREALR